LTGIETAIGVVDVKSSPVYFHVQRNETYNSVDTTIPFQFERLNVGGGMNITSGIFTAPKSGIYFFSFTGTKSSPANPLYVFLYHNSNRVTIAYGYSLSGYFTATLSSTLSLKSGDQISLKLFFGQLHDDTDHYTNFNGMLLQEELIS
jgi:C1q-related factor